MPFFFILPIWFLCLIAGLGMMFSVRFRYLSTYLILSSTLGLVLSFLLSTAVLVLLPKVDLPSNVSGIVFILGCLAAMGAGGVLGIGASLLSAHTLNGKIGWRKFSFKL
jgi:hypothetical protein